MNVAASTIAQPSQNSAQIANRAGWTVMSHTADGMSRHCQSTSARIKLASNTYVLRSTG